MSNESNEGAAQTTQERPTQTQDPSERVNPRSIPADGNTTMVDGAGVGRGGAGSIGNERRPFRIGGAQ